jgi:hypothetical protein
MHFEFGVQREKPTGVFHKRQRGDWDFRLHAVGDDAHAAKGTMGPNLSPGQQNLFQGLTNPFSPETSGRPALARHFVRDRDGFSQGVLVEYEMTIDCIVLI